MGVIYDTSRYATPEILSLKQLINDEDDESNAVQWAQRARQRKMCAQYDELMLRCRPNYPTVEHLEALGAVSELLHSGTQYGDHLGCPTEEDKRTGRSLPWCVHYSSRAQRVNILAGSPYAAGSPRRLWRFDEHDLQTIQNTILSLSLSILDEWAHDDGHGYMLTAA